MPRYQSSHPVQFAALAALLIAGCDDDLRNRLVEPRDVPAAELIATPQAPAKPTHVDLGGTADVLREDEETAVQPEQLLRRVEQHLKQDQHRSARSFVRLYPDVVLDLLRRGLVGEHRSQTLSFIAESYDEQCSIGESSVWSELANGEPQRHWQEYADQRSMKLQALHGGRVDEALAIDLPGVLDPHADRLLLIDAYRITAIAYLLADQPDLSAAAFGQAVELCQPDQLHQKARLQLLHSEALRRAGQTEQSVVEWQSAVSTMSRLLQHATVPDPAWWQQASYLRPVGTEWPAELGRALQPTLTRFGIEVGDGPIDPLLWAAVGHWRYEREETQSALLAFKRAETSTTHRRSQARLQLAQARCFLQMGQTAPANQMLVGLAGNPDPTVASAAIATLGTMKLQQGSPRQGLNLLRRALQDETIDWPGRNEAVADLGLAYLMMGDETNGVKNLHEAQRRFERGRDKDLLVKSLWNEAQYLRQSDRDREARKVEKRIAAIEEHVIGR